MKSRSGIGLLIILAETGALVAFELIGSSGDAEGFLREPFPLLPIGWALVGLGVLAAAVRALQRPPGQK